MRQNIYDLLATYKIDVISEYQTLLRLTKKERGIYCNGFGYSLFEYIDSHYFRELPFRGTFTSIDQMMDVLHISSPSTNLNTLLTFCEFLIAITPKSERLRCNYYQKQVSVIRENISVILDKTNHELVLYPESEDKYIIVEKNKEATLAAQLVEDKQTAFDIIEYNHFALKGNLNAKKKLLVSIAAYLEPILRSNILQKNGYKNLESNIGFVFNNFHIRHNNKEGVNAKEYIKIVSDDELEQWYDKAYDMAITTILLSNNISVADELAELKKKYKW